MRYADARFAEKQRNAAYRIYVTDALQSIAQNTARFNGGMIIKKRYADIINRKVETRTSAEVISALKAKLAKVGEK